MPDIWLGYGGTTVENCEDAWTSDQGGAVTCSTEGTYKKVGTYSAKFVIVDSASGLLAHEETGTLDLSGKTHIAFWIRVSANVAAGLLQFCVDDDTGCASPYTTANLPALSADTWYRLVLPSTGIASTDSVGIKATSTIGTLTIYIDDVIALTAKEYDVLAVRGLDDVEDVIYNPAQAIKQLDGGYYEWTAVSWNRRISVILGAVMTKADRVWLSTFLRQSTKRILKDEPPCDDVLVVWDSPEDGSFQANWLADVSLFRSYAMSFIEKTARTTDPDSWS